MCITLIYILTWFKSTHLSDIIITHLLQGKTPFFLHLRRAATGVAHRRPANTPPALPGILIDSAHSYCHCVLQCNGSFLLSNGECHHKDSCLCLWHIVETKPLRYNLGTSTYDNIRSDNKSLVYLCKSEHTHTQICSHRQLHKKSIGMVIKTSLGGMFMFCVSWDFTVRVCIKDFPKGHAGLFSSQTSSAQAIRSDLGDRSHI